MRFLDSLGIPIIAVLRDTQNFVHAAEQGLGMHEMQPSRVRPDLQEVEKILGWLDGWEARRKRGLHITGMYKRPFSRVSVLRKTQAGSA